MNRYSSFPRTVDGMFLHGSQGQGQRSRSPSSKNLDADWSPIIHKRSWTQIRLAVLKKT